MRGGPMKRLALLAAAMAVLCGPALAQPDGGGLPRLTIRFALVKPAPPDLEGWESQVRGALADRMDELFANNTPLNFRPDQPPSYAVKQQNRTTWQAWQDADRALQVVSARTVTIGGATRVETTIYLGDRAGELAKPTVKLTNDLTAEQTAVAADEITYVAMYAAAVDAEKRGQKREACKFLRGATDTLEAPGASLAAVQQAVKNSRARLRCP